MTKLSQMQCGICVDCVPQVDGGSGFTNCDDAHAAETAGGKLQLTTSELTTPLKWVAEAYFVHLIVRHRRPVYRHINGDMALNVPSIAAFIDGYLAEKRTKECRQKLYLSLLNFRAMEDEHDKAWLVNWGGVPLLTPRGLRLVDAMFNRLGFMAEEVDLTNCDMLGKTDAH